MNITSLPTPDLSEVRRRAVLDAAVSVFARFGFRKTSMDDVARAAGVSRQGLYLIFSTKEELFRRALDHSLSNQLNAALCVLSQGEKSLEERLIAACDEWSGRFAGGFVGDAADLMCAGTSLAGDTMRHYEGRFEQALAAAFAAPPTNTLCRNAGVQPAQAARALHATARGLKHTSSSRQDFHDAVGAAVRMFCAPLAQQRKPPAQQIKKRQA
jgi:AcrR family transcriptional regulator